jgi:4-alpha-glucanotransferase
MTAKKGVWKRGPGRDFFLSMKKQLGELPFVAEDLGEITNDVYKLRDDFNLPGMKVLQFAFNEKLPESIHAPHHHQLNCIVYTGTHDNNTLIGWFSTELNEENKRLLNKYTGIEVTAENIFEVLGRMAFSSVAEKIILPLQDWLGMDETARMNKPSSPENNWGWRLLPGQTDEQVENKMREWTWLYNRD